MLHCTEWQHFTLRELTVWHLGDLHGEHQREREGGDDEEDGAEGQQERAEAHAVLAED